MVQRLGGSVPAVAVAPAHFQARTVRLLGFLIKEDSSGILFVVQYASNPCMVLKKKGYQLKMH